MPETSPQQVTQILHRVTEGEQGATDELLPLVYSELRSLARARMHREKPGQTLQPTALVHEAYIRLLGGEEVSWKNRGHFFGAAAEAMRRILIERARKYARPKQGGHLHRAELETTPAQAADLDELLALDQALNRLEERDETMAQVVKLRYFAGLKVDETARALEVSERTVNRHWTVARAWLYRELKTREEESNV